MSAVEYFPPTRNFGRTQSYGVVVALVGIILTSVAVSSLTIPGAVATILILIGLATYLAANYRALEIRMRCEGVYRWGKSIFQWQQVKRIMLDFEKSSGSFPLFPRPTWASLAGGLPMVVHEEWVSYGASMVFVRKDGTRFAIRSNLDNPTKRRVVESVDELAKAANPRIEFE
jgi:hypothetical protein